MGRYVNNTDFVGKYQISQGIYNTSMINDFIDKYEEIYLQELLGVDLYNQFKADADANAPTYIPTEPRFIKIFNQFTEQIGFTFMRSVGFKEMLIGFIYWKIVVNEISVNTVAGTVQQKGENSKNVLLPLYKNYNDSVSSYNAIQRFIILNFSDYSEFQGMKKEKTYWI